MSIPDRSRNLGMIAEPILDDQGWSCSACGNRRILNLESQCSGCGATFDPPPRRVSVAQARPTKYKDPTENRAIVAVLSLPCLGILFYGAWLYRQGMSSFIAGADGNTHSVQRGSFQTPSPVEPPTQIQTPTTTQSNQGQMPYDPDNDPGRDLNWENALLEEDILIADMETTKLAQGFANNDQVKDVLGKYRWIINNWPRSARYKQSTLQADHPWLHAGFDQELINQANRRYRVGG